MRTAVVATATLFLAACAGGPAGDDASVGFLDAGAVQRLARDIVARGGPAAAPPPSTPPGSDRWWLAIVHAELRAPEAAQHFDCALGARLMAAPRPALTQMMDALAHDARAAALQAARTRPAAAPFVVRPDLRPCQRVTPATASRSSWPSDGAAVAAAYGELMTALAPDRAEQVRAVAREVARSRVVCRMSWPADAAAGQDLGRDVFVEAMRQPRFQALLPVARREIDEARAEGLANPGCAAERRALAATPDAG